MSIYYIDDSLFQHVLFFGGVCSKRAGSTTSKVLLRLSSHFQWLALAARRSYVPFLFLENKKKHRYIYDS